MTDITHILTQLETGDPHAAEQLFPLIYDMLRKLAAEKIARERPGQTLQPTALVHEAYLRLVDTERVQHFNSRGHFFGAAAEAMRRILVENARRKGRQKHGGEWDRAMVDLALVADAGGDEDLLALDEALERLKIEDPLKARLVDLRFFAGLTNDEAAAALGISAPTAKRYWRYARAWLHRAVSGEAVPSTQKKK